jgi:DNA polymerase-4
VTESRCVAHVDMDAFFAQVEKLDNPELEDKPVIVGGLGERGVVSTASYEAREYGCHSAQPMAEARERCPGAEFISPRGERYAEVSGRIKDILFQLTPTVESVSLDEAFLDITGVLHRYDGPTDFGQQLRDRILEETELTASVGVGPNKMIAKLASDRCKPDGLEVVDGDRRKRFLEPLPIDSMWGVGERTEERMRSLGIDTVGDLQSISLSTLQEEFDQRAPVYKQRAEGIDPDPVTVHEPAKSISNETTFEEDLTDPETIENQLYRMTDKMASRARGKSVEGTTVTIKLRRGDFSTLTRSRTLDYATNSTDTVWPVVRTLFRNHFELDDRGIRLVGAGLSNLREEDVQGDLFDEQEESDPTRRREDVNDVIDELKDSFGDDTIGRGRDLKL